MVVVHDHSLANPCRVCFNDFAVRVKPAESLIGRGREDAMSDIGRPRTHPEPAPNVVHVLTTKDPRMKLFHTEIRDVRAYNWSLCYW